MEKLLAHRSPRLAVRAVLLDDTGRLLLVNAWPGADCDLWCAPGGGVDPGGSLPDNLVREMREETGLAIEVGSPCLINEFHDPESGFHQVEIFFRCTLAAPADIGDWTDPEGVVTRRRWVSSAEIGALRVKPSSLPRLAFETGFGYDPLEHIVR
ncbi:NUDIX domain-containing protein [Tropicimonas sp.]|uniref:NUDIX domain-containing protein n=1 Tax=Tropicimonas sp. TaxID=2067044 RepID=UPI003A8C3046